MLFVLHALTGCGGESVFIPEEGNNDFAIAFSPRHDVEEKIFSRAGEPASLARDFTVFGSKTIADGYQMVFPGYRVTCYADAYDYVNPALSQTLKYWDENATEYIFWAFAGEDASANGNVVTIPMSLSTTADNSNLYSEKYRRCPVTTEVVPLTFKQPHSRISVLFYCAEPLGTYETTEITDISFSPVASAQAPKATAIWLQGTATVTYPVTGDARETVTVTCREPLADNSCASLAFRPVSLTATAGNSASTAVAAEVDGNHGTHYYALPMGEQNPDFVLKLNINGAEHEITIPASLMSWQPNMAHTYLFKIMESGGKIALDDVKIEKWTFGGSQNNNLNNW